MSWREELGAYLAHLENGGRASGYVANTKTYLTALGNRYTPESYLALSYDELDSWFSLLRKRGRPKKGKKARPLAESSLKTAFTHTRACLRWLHLQATGKKETPPNILGMRHGKAESRVASPEDLLTDTDLEKLLTVLDAKWRCALLLLRWSGARPSEILGCARRDAVLKTRDGKEYAVLTFRQTKNGKTRSVPVLKPEAVEALKLWRDLGPQSGLLFPSPRQPDQPLKYRSFWKALKTAATRAGLEKNVFPYLARHTRASELYEAPSAIRDAALGFQTPTMWKNYTHLNEATAMRDYLWDETEGAPLVSDEAMEILKDVRNQLVALSSKDAAMAEALKDILGSMPMFKMSRGARNPLANTQAKLQKLIEALEGVSD